MSTHMLNRPPKKWTPRSFSLFNFLPFFSSCPFSFSFVSFLLFTKEEEQNDFASILDRRTDKKGCFLSLFSRSCSYLVIFYVSFATNHVSVTATQQIPAKLIQPFRFSLDLSFFPKKKIMSIPVMLIVNQNCSCMKYITTTAYYRCYLYILFFRETYSITKEGGALGTIQEKSWDKVTRAEGRKR